MCFLPFNAKFRPMPQSRSENQLSVLSRLILKIYFIGTYSLVPASNGDNALRETTTELLVAVLYKLTYLTVVVLNMNEHQLYTFVVQFMFDRVANILKCAMT